MNAFQRNEEIKSLQSQAEAIGKSNLDSVLLLLNGAEKLATADELVAVESESEWVKAKTYYSLGDYEKSQRFALSAIEKATIVTNDTVLAKSYNLMGVLLKRAYKLDQAMAAYRKSLGYKERLSDSLGVSTTLQNLGGLFRTLGLLDSSYIYYQRSIEIKRALKDTVALASSIGGLGTYYYDIGQYKMAVDLFRQAYDVNVALDDKSKIALYAMNMGSGYRGLGYYELSLRNYLQSLTLYRSLGLRKEEGSALFNIASLYKLLKKFDVALEYYLKSLKIYEETNRDKDKADIYLSMGDLYLLEKRATEALEFFSQAEEIYTKNNELRDLALVRHGQGKAYARMEDYGKSKALYQESLLGLDQQNDKDEIGNVYSSLAVTNYKGKEYKEALKNYEVALNISQELKLPSLFKGALIGFAEIYQATGNSRKAYDYRLQYDVMKDSLDNVEKSRQIAELREIYESEKKDEQITQLELENELVSAKSQANAALADQQRTEKLIFITTAIALFVLAVTLYFYFRQRLTLTKLIVKEEKEGHIKAVNELMVQQQTKTLEAMVDGQEKERKRIAKELHDHFGSLMAAVKVNLSAVAEDNLIAMENSEQMKNLAILVDKACEDIRTLSHSMNIGISENFGLIPALKDLANSISQSERIQVQFHASNFNQELDLATEVTAYRLVQELVSNALKHAKATKITIQLTCFEDILNLIVEDNGVGFDADYLMENSIGLGLKSIQTRINNVKGDFEVDSQIGKGTTVIIDLPVMPELSLILS